MVLPEIHRSRDTYLPMSDSPLPTVGHLRVGLICTGDEGTPILDTTIPVVLSGDRLPVMHLCYMVFGTEVLPVEDLPWHGEGLAIVSIFI